VENNGRASLETDRAQSGLDIVALGASQGKSLQGKTCGFDAPNVALGNSDARLGSDRMEEIEQVVFGSPKKLDPILSHCVRSSRA